MVRLSLCRRGCNVRTRSSDAYDGNSCDKWVPMFEVTFLGTAASTPSAERGLPAVLVQAGSERFLIDCGEGTQRQLLRAGSGFRRLGHVLLTHAHLDHVLGLGGLIATLGLMDLRETLRICGSRQTMHFVAQY